MCCRYTIAVTAKRLAEKFNAAINDELFKERYNAAPGQYLPLININKPKEFQFYKWGLLPHWAKDPKIANKLLNARAETILEKPSFKNYFKCCRCLIPADGFYEWKKTKPHKTPYRITLKNSEPFAFAGITSIWHEKEKDETATFTIITTAPNTLVKKIHDRMPVILKKEDYAKWLDPDLPPEEAHALLKPYPAKDMKAYEISTKVNSPANDFPELIKEK